MSTDQQWATGASPSRGARGMEHEQMHERRVPVLDRFVPFLAPFLMSLLVVPGVELVSWSACVIWPAYQGMVIICWCVLGFLTAGLAALYGATVTKRVPLLWRLVAVTLVAWGLSGAMTTAYGLWTLPPWLVIHLFGSLFFGLLWAVLRTDALRTAAANGTGKDVWGEVIGLRTSRPRSITRTPTGAEIIIDHGPGETRANVRTAANQLESLTNAISGRTTVTDVDSANGASRSGSSLVRIALVDAFADWLTVSPSGDVRNAANEPTGMRFPSHPGGSFALPMSTGYYETGEPEWFSFAASLPSPLTEFRSDMDTFLGAAGTTGSGKSGGINNTAAEALTRCDVIPCWLDRAKIEQNAAWCLDMLGMAGNDENARDFTVALRKLAEHRVKLFGQVSLQQMAAGVDPDTEVGRKWTPELARETGEAAVLAIVDEADTAIQGKDWEWLSARARSLGIFLYVATPRASASEVPALVRGSVGAWKTYAIGDNYSDGFTISNETADAGADPKRLRSPGLHYLDRAPGLSLQQCATLAREFQSSPGRLRELVLQSRGVTFEPATFTPAAVAAMGEEYQRCRPERLALNAAVPPADDPTPADRAGSAGRTEKTPTTHDEDDGEDDDMRATAEGTDELAGVARPIDPGSLLDDEELEFFRNADTEVPIPAPAGPELRFQPAKPVWSAERTEAELDRAIVALKRRGQTRFTNGDLMDEMACHMNAVTCSRRLAALDAGKRTAPGGLRVQQSGRGQFDILGEIDPNYNAPSNTEEI